ncbi:MAG: hypothetical protein GX413_05225 [Acetobacter sp.]|nr:hypothetical protein [Acetobacter sp.]
MERILRADRREALQKALGKTNMSPTPERAEKGIFSKGRPVREKTVVDSMLQSGDIEQREADAADRWFRIWTFAYEGYREFPEGHTPNSEIKHDDLSWLMTRADAAGMLVDVRTTLGLCTEVRLKAMVVEKLTFRVMAKRWFPSVSDALGRKKACAQCALVLEQLAELYEAQRKKCVDLQTNRLTQQIVGP